MKNIKKDHPWRKPYLDNLPPLHEDDVPLLMDELVDCLPIVSDAEVTEYFNNIAYGIYEEEEDYD